ncbi:MAG: hypothetical protein GX303_01765 [Clostridiales bacterium]|nr:hypothetical protein [Clostridiales bacterium]
MTLFSCSSLISLSYEDGVLIDNKNNVSYTYASISFEPVSIGEKYAEYKKANLVLYTIPGLSPTEWLTEDYDGIGLVFYSTDITLPTLAEFEPVKVLVSVTADVSIPLAEITDAEVISAIVDRLQNGEKAIMPATHEYSYTLKFVSEKYPSIYYTVRYLDCGDNRLYLFDQGEKKSVYADGLLEDYFQDDALE